MRDGATIGAQATIGPGVTIGRFAMVGMGSVVTRDVPDHAIVYGNPARVVGYACACGEKFVPAGPPRVAGMRCTVCGARYPIDGSACGRAGVGITMRFAVVGGGLLGMTTAWNLVKAGHQATIFEAAPDCGGLASPWQLGDVVWDRHYHVTLLSDLTLRALLQELALEGELRWVKAQTGFYVDGSLYPFSSALDYLRFPPLSPVQKLRLGSTILRAARITDWRPLERITAAEWLTRLSGRVTFERIWLPLLRAKLGPNAERASAAFIWAIIARMYGARRTGSKRELFGYVRGGYQRTLRRFERELRLRGVEIRTSCPVKRVEPLGDGITVVTDGRADRFDRAVVTLAPPLAARLCPTLTARRARALPGRRVSRHNLRVTAAGRLR